jgi:hypothetical protein
MLHITFSSSGGFMKSALKPLNTLAALSFFAIATLATASAQPETIVSRTSQVDGVKLHYLTAGHGPAVLLLHGYTQRDSP